MKQFAVIIHLLILASCACAQTRISTHIDGYTVVGQPDSRRACPRPFIGTFDFRVLPAPLREAEVDFTLTALRESVTDWDVSVWALNNEHRVDIIGDSVYVWKAPIKVGDQFSGSIRFVPLASGVTSLDVGLLSGGIECGLTFTWCLSEDGELLYLGNSELEPRQRVECDVLPTFFFAPDSVRMTDPPSHNKSAVFGHEIVIRPVPHVGDTSFITFRLTANEDYPSGADYRVDAGGVEVVSIPGPLSDPIGKDQQFDFTVGVVPHVTDAVAYVRLQFFGELARAGRGHSSKAKRADFIFDREGRLKYVTNFGVSMRAREQFPDPYSEPGQAYSGRIEVLKSGGVTRDGRSVRNTKVGGEGNK